MVETLDNREYADIRGFNYQPSHGSHGMESWGTEFNPSLMKKELWSGKHHFPEMNTVRIWLSYDAYTRFPERFPERLGEVLDLGDDYDVEFIVTLFNGWHSYPDLGGLHPFSLERWHSGDEYEEVFEPYVEATAGTYADHDNVLMWDLCNEPTLSGQGIESVHDFEVDRSKTIYRFLETVYEQIQTYDPSAPTTVGTIPDTKALELYEPITEVLTTHPYYIWNRDNTPTSTEEGFREFVDEAVRFANEVDKPLLGNETGWGALDDRKRAETLEVELGTQAEAGIGFTAHLLHHTPVADGHKPPYGPVSDPGYMAFVDPDGSIRPHHEVFNEY
jgi:hypothetical protein